MRIIKLRLAGGLVAVAAVIALLTTACADSGGGASRATTAQTNTTAPSSSVAPTTIAEPITTETPTPTTSAAPPTTFPITTATPPAQARDFEEVIGVDPEPAGWLVEPGRYISNRLDRAPSFVVDELLTLVVYEEGIIGLGKRNVTMSQMDAVFFLEPVGIMPVDTIGTHPEHDPIVPEATQPLPDTLEDWLDSAPQIVVVESGEERIAGGAARFWELAVDPAAGPTFDCGRVGRPECVAFIVDKSLGPFTIWDGTRFRVWRLTGPGEGLWAFMQSVPDTYEDTLELTNDLLASMEF